MNHKQQILVALDKIFPGFKLTKFTPRPDLPLTDAYDVIGYYYVHISKTVRFKVNVSVSVSYEGDDNSLFEYVFYNESVWADKQSLFSGSKNQDRGIVIDKKQKVKITRTLG